MTNAATKIPAVLLHLLPLVPLLYGRYALVVAAVLLIAIPYIKVKKMTAAMRHIEERFPGALPPVMAKEHESLRVARERWAALTLPWLAKELG